MAHPVTFAVRNTANTKLILLIHGFCGESHATFGMLPAFIAGDPHLTDWDIYCFGYPTHLAPDITGVWSADPDLHTLAGYLNTKIVQTDLFEQYQQIALMAHSMGGLIVQRALLDGGFLNKVSHVLLFGTPSNGLKKAGLGKIFKRQARDMNFGGTFITQLRADWNRKFSNPLPFEFYAIAGIKDEFVPTASSVELFEPKYRHYIEGNHISMVKPSNLEGDAIALLRKVFCKKKQEVKNSTAYPGAYQQTISGLTAKIGLSDQEVVDLALAWEMNGEQAKALTLLENSYKGKPELTGVLAGRYKREWLAEPVDKQETGKKAFELYQEAFEQAAAENDHEQAFYNGINVAFMQLALLDHHHNACMTAEKVLEHCRQAALMELQQRKSKNLWRLATEAEAKLYMGEIKMSMENYEEALLAAPNPREVASMYKQAVWVARLLEHSEVERCLQQLFHPYITL